ncbi:VWA domain-containing protein [Egibacter rhizosphaerae]|uniref:VWA domain-containing protein n=1 Tax=Egibacter rhizosphaerae TaxID=1670831 RepID=A0A411YBS4_9ACTN|nr:VWA domain-containing protein [Egibacter rhizosphaerae]QBI18650.1 VWA domain-containing protein [Egibacter rhizosphaerae]
MTVGTVTGDPTGRIDPGQPLVERVLGLTRALRAGGVPASTSDGMDAVRALASVDLADPRRVREALAATLCSSVTHRPLFDTLFDVHFAGTAAPPEVDAPRGAPAFVADLAGRVARGDDVAVAALAREAVGAFGRVQGRHGQEAHYASRVFAEVNLGGLLRRLLDAHGDDEDAFERRLAEDVYVARLRRFREEVEADARRREVARRGADAVARGAVSPLPEDVDLLRLSPGQEAELRRETRALARRIATRLARRRRRAADGRLDARRTLRRAAGTGGVPVAPAFAARRRTRPRLVVLADVSGSMARFARFTLLLCHALSDQFADVRSFAFVDALDEVTDLLAEPDPVAAIASLDASARVVRLDGHSDYGAALEGLATGYPDAVGPRTTLLVLGDARGNYRPSGETRLADLCRRARRAVWLNPEPATQWGTGDSYAARYTRHVDLMAECRTLRQLERLVPRLA